jgi:hypothetical protein
MNQEELIKELAKALCRIGDALPQAETQVVLYPTCEMQALIINLHLMVFKFAQRALDWYNEGRLKHAVSAIVRPYSLRFQDLVERIIEITRQIKDVASSMNMVELRRTRIELEEARRELQETKELAMEMRRALEGLSHIPHIVLDTSKRVCEIQFSQLMSFTATSVLPTPENVRQYHRVRRNRRRRRGFDDDGFLRDSQQLHSWVNQRNSSQIAVCSSFQARHAARDFATDAIDLILDAEIPVIWALKPRNDFEGDVASIDVLKYLVSQILQQNHTMLNERSAALSAARYQSARSEDDWINILGSAFEGLPQVYVIVDMEILSTEMMTDRSWPAIFTLLAERLSARAVKTVVKVAFVVTRTTHKALVAEDLDQRRILQIPFNRSGQIHKQKEQSRMARRRNRSRLLSLASTVTDDSG